MKYLPQSKLPAWRELNTPKACPVSGRKIKRPVVDHDHITGMVRGVLDSEINSWEGRIFNSYKKLSPYMKRRSYPEMLEALAKYLKQEPTNLLHPKGNIQLYKRFANMSKDTQIELLTALKMSGMKIKVKDILACANGKERTKLYKETLTQDRYE